MAAASALNASTSKEFATQSEVEMENNDNPDISQEKLLQKLGLNSVQHLALRSESVQDASENLPGGVIDETNVANIVDENGDDDDDVEGPQVVPSNPTSNSNSRSSTPLAQLNGNTDEKLPSRKTNRVDTQKLKVESLKEELQCEETKLLLLKKILESQAIKRIPGTIRPRDQVYSKNVHPSLHSKYPRTNDTASKIHIAPKVVLPTKNGSGGSSMPRVVPSIVSSSSAKPATHIPINYPNGAQNASSNHGTNQSPGSGSRKYYIQVGSQLLPASSSSVYSPPPYYGNAPITHTPSTHSSRRSDSPVETQLSKQSAAKNALRRQLEQTLLQIPPPNPPPADWETIPNVNSMDFMTLVGLDDIVDMILDLDGKPTMKRALLNMIPEKPYECDQCHVDFSPAWKPKPGAANNVVLCERCAVTNVKKELKAEHTSRLKSAFIKALKQEQDIEEKIKAGEDVAFPGVDRPESSSRSTDSHHIPSQTGHGHVHTHQPANQSDRHRPVGHRHHHPVVAHYPRHTSLVHQLHQQHLQQQPADAEPPSGHHASGSRWHPYAPNPSSQGHHSRIHTPAHRPSQNLHQPGSQHNYGTSSNGRHEYYVVHHPQHANTPQHSNAHSNVPQHSNAHSNARWSRQ